MLLKLKHLFTFLLLTNLFTVIPCKIIKAGTVAGDTICLADPTIFYDKGQYYLYGTGSNNGFEVYQSADLQNWHGPLGIQNGYALLKGDSYGTHGFWAPQIFKYKSKYYMAYTANEHIAIAESNSPLGPFKQNNIKPISGQGKQIDPYIFKDSDGKLYLYHVRLQQGNRIFVARLKDDLSDIDTATARECLSANEAWENTANASWPVSEGPTVIKLKNVYYMLYSANDFRNIDYAVGYATATSPLGPWKKYDKNPILSRKTIGINGSGHGDLFFDRQGHLQYVFHTHKNNQQTGVRKTAIIKLTLSGKPNQLVADKNSFRFLMLDTQK